MKKNFILLLLITIASVSCSHISPSRKIAQEYGNETGNKSYIDSLNLYDALTKYACMIHFKKDIVFEPGSPESSKESLKNLEIISKLDGNYSNIRKISKGRSFRIDVPAENRFMNLEFKDKPIRFIHLAGKATWTTLYISDHTVQDIETLSEGALSITCEPFRTEEL